jgi:hypothetical protein
MMWSWLLLVRKCLDDLNFFKTKEFISIFLHLGTPPPLKICFLFMFLYLTSAPSKMDPSSGVDPSLVYNQLRKLFQHNILLMNRKYSQKFKSTFGANSKGGRQSRTPPRVSLTRSQEKGKEGLNPLHICFSWGDQYHMSRDWPTNTISNMKNLEKKACSRCGEEGHPASNCPGNYPNYGAIHSIKDCTTRLVTCYPCEGNDHTPNKCPMDFLVIR